MTEFTAISIGADELRLTRDSPRQEYVVKEKAGSDLGETDTRVLSLCGKAVELLVEGSHRWFLQDFFGPDGSKVCGNERHNVKRASHSLYKAFLECKAFRSILRSESELWDRVSTLNQAERDGMQLVAFLTHCYACYIHSPLHE